MARTVKDRRSKAGRRVCGNNPLAAVRSRFRRRTAFRNFRWRRILPGVASREGYFVVVATEELQISNHALKEIRQL
jgi:hypothetical protein